MFGCVKKLAAWIVLVLRWLAGTRPTVGPIGKIELVSERRINHMDILKYSVTLPTDANILALTVDRSVASEANGVAAHEVLSPVTGPVEIEAVQDSEVTLSLTATDEAGNISAPVVREFTAMDTIPPQMYSDAIGVELIGERTVADEA